MRGLLGLLIIQKIVGRGQRLVYEHIGLVWIAQVLKGSGSCFCGLGMNYRSGGSVRAMAAPIPWFLSIMGGPR